MKELKRLRVKFVLSNMVMVTFVIGLAFLGVGYFTKNQIDRDNEKMLGMAVEVEHAGSFLEWEGIARMPYFIVVQMETTRSYRWKTGMEWDRIQNW